MSRQPPDYFPNTLSVPNATKSKEKWSDQEEARFSPRRIGGLVGGLGGFLHRHGHTAARRLPASLRVPSTPRRDPRDHRLGLAAGVIVNPRDLLDHELKGHIQQAREWRFGYLPGYVRRPSAWRSDVRPSTDTRYTSISLMRSTRIGAPDSAISGQNEVATEADRIRPANRGAD